MKDILKSHDINWLLETENPSARYFMVKDISDKPDDDESVQTAKRDIMRSGLVPDILQKQREAAYLQAYPNFIHANIKVLCGQEG